MIFFFFCSICFLGWLEVFFLPQLDNSDMPLDPSPRDRISLSSHKHRPVFCCFDSGTREITLWIQKGAFPLRKRTNYAAFLNLRVISLVVVSILVQGKSLFESKKGRFPYRNVQCSILDPKSDFPCTRIETTTSSLGLNVNENMIYF